MTQREQDAFNEGFESRLRDENEPNPYYRLDAWPHINERWRAWNAGWNDLDEHLHARTAFLADAGIRWFD